MMQLLNGLHITEILRLTYPLWKVDYPPFGSRLTVLAWKPGSDADEMWLALTKFANNQRESEQPVMEKEIA